MTVAPWVLILLVAGAVAWLGPRVGRAARTAWLQRARRDPRQDPWAARATPEMKDQLEQIVARGVASPAGALAARADLVAAALRVCEVEAWCWHWRGGLRFARGWADGLGSSHDVDVRAVDAELRAALGEIDLARARIEGLPADHWRACMVRAMLYDADGDLDRAEAALVAALQLCPSGARGAVQTQLTSLRTQRV